MAASLSRRRSTPKVASVSITRKKHTKSLAEDDVQHVQGHVDATGVTHESTCRRMPAPQHPLQPTSRGSIGRAAAADEAQAAYMLEGVCAAYKVEPSTCQGCQAVAKCTYRPAWPPDRLLFHLEADHTSALPPPILGNVWVGIAGGRNRGKRARKTSAAGSRPWSKARSSNRT